MKATCAYLTAARRIELRECELQPREDQVLVRIHACGICRGDLNEFLLDRSTPSTFGHEPVGQVVAVGPFVRNLVEGDWVTGGIAGAFATHGLGCQNKLFRIPPELGEYGALVEPIKCVTTTVRAASPDYGDTVVVVGCGFMGLAAIATLANGWQRRLIAVETDTARQALAREFGATHIVNPTDGEAVARVREIADGKGAHVVIDFAGRQDATDLAARMLRDRGRLIAAAGFLPRDNKLELYLKGLTIHATPPMFSPDEADDWRRTVEEMANKRYPLPRLLTHRHSLSDIQKAFETALEGSRTGYLKGIIEH